MKYKDGLKKWAKKEKVFSSAEVKLDDDDLFIEVDSEDIEEADQEGEIEPTELHERVPFFCGSYNMVEKAEEFMHKAKLSKY